MNTKHILLVLSVSFLMAGSVFAEDGNIDLKSLCENSECLEKVEQIYLLRSRVNDAFDERIRMLEEYINLSSDSVAEVALHNELIIKENSNSIFLASLGMAASCKPVTSCLARMIPDYLEEIEKMKKNRSVLENQIESWAKLNEQKTFADEFFEFLKK